MTSNDIENELSELFLELAKAEKTIELYRQILSETVDFDARQIFNYLLSSDQSNINSKDIMKFLSMNKINITEDESNLIVLFYDSNFDGKLSFEEFLNLVRSEKSSINNKSINFSDDTNIGLTINFSLCKLFEKEIYFAKSLINILKDLQNKYGFNIHDLYHSIKSTNFITSESLKNFLNNNNVNFLESDINLIMKKLDLNKDGKIDLCELHLFLGFPFCKYNCLKNKCNTCGASYCKECYIESHWCNPKNYTHPYNYKYNDGGMENKSPNIQFKYNNINYNNFYQKPKTPEEKKEENDNIVNYDKLNNFTDLRQNSYEIQRFNYFMKFLLEEENKIEKMKIELCKIKDFNVEDTFRLFEKDGRGFLDLEDLKYGFGVLNVYPNEFDMKIFMKRFDFQRKGFISYADFFDIVVPFEKEIREEVEKRIPKSNCVEVILGREVSNALKNLFKAIFNFENKVNIERKSLDINIKEIFNIFENNNQKYFDFTSFNTYLNSYDLLENNENNPDLLYIRLDKNRNGRIDFDEFVDEMKPA